ncbi:hypothetical protein BC939DRAFT_531526 [Gamsiella multidivaricata]|uniref:uncharacterized protein n=1 Tax=Gamsiella multidivaricata TaxID=101098 RepID=UPI002220D562|nr:uncharacterized protein BC939DRAFT_531526 [Gamsiella multidivaricata]KAI7819053.1 hypothetical protein BC939DRAFT_531526 [Gamsiella multidivaricata]
MATFSGVHNITAHEALLQARPTSPTSSDNRRSMNNSTQHWRHSSPSPSNSRILLISFRSREPTREKARCRGGYPCGPGAPTKRSFERMEQREAEVVMLQQHHDDENNRRDASRQRRSGTTGVGLGAKGKGITVPRIPARPNSSNAGASRVGAGGAVRKLVRKLIMKRMAERLPLRYRNELHC